MYKLSIRLKVYSLKLVCHKLPTGQEYDGTLNVMESLTLHNKDKVNFTVCQGNSAKMYQRIGQSLILKF